MYQFVLKQGDSGGPLLITNQNYPLVRNIIGVTSFGKACGIPNVPGVYSRISYYVPWIEEIVWPYVEVMQNPNINGRDFIVL